MSVCIPFRLVVGLLLTVCFGCGEPFPRDPEGTSQRVLATRVVRVGVSEHPPWIVRGDGPTPTGREAELVLAFAKQRGARVEWTWGQLEALFASLSAHRLDLVVGGIDADTPWKDRLGFTEPWQTPAEGSGVPATHFHQPSYPSHVVLAVPPGENRWLGEVELFAQQFVTDAVLPRVERAP